MSGAAEFGLLMLGLTLFGMIKKIGLIGYAVWFEMACPEASARLLQRYQANPRACTLIGACVGLPGLVAGTLLLWLGSGAAFYLGLILWIIVLCFLVYGHSAMYHDKALRVNGIFGAKSISSKIVVAGIMLEFAFLAPIIGQALAAVLWMRSFGAAVLLAFVPKAQPLPAKAGQTPQAQ